MYDNRSLLPVVGAVAPVGIRTTALLPNNAAEDIVIPNVDGPDTTPPESNIDQLPQYLTVVPELIDAILDVKSIPKQTNQLLLKLGVIDDVISFVVVVEPVVPLVEFCKLAILFD